MIIIKNGRIVLPHGVENVDILIKDGVISDIGINLEYEDDDKIIDAQGCYVFSGFIDGHTHFDMDNGKIVTADNFESGTKAALAGGTTTIIDFATQEKGNTLSYALDTWHRKAYNNCYVNYGFHMAITDWNEITKKEISSLFLNGVCSYKIYFAYDALKVNDKETMDILSEIKNHNGILGVHCENGDIINKLILQHRAAGNLQPSAHPLSRPSEVEAEAVNRLLYISKIINYPVNIVHLSSYEALKEIRIARAKGQKVYVESCPQYFLLNDRCYLKPDFEGAKYVISPPLRSKGDNTELTKAVISGEIDTIATDHCSYNFIGQKDIGRDDYTLIPNGAPGVENRAELIYTFFVSTGLISVNKFAELLSQNPAEIYGMGQCKGKLKIGYDADITIWETGIEKTISASTHHMNVDYNLFEGFVAVGRAKTVIIDGKIAMENGIISLNKNGKYVKRNISKNVEA